MPAHARDPLTSTTATARPALRADAGAGRLSQRDIDGLLLAGEHDGVPCDLLTSVLQVQPDREPPSAAFGPERPA